jgi:hypothetical protein
MSVEGLGQGRKANLAEAREIAKNNPDAAIIWRPESELPEAEQYALIYNE